MDRFEKKHLSVKHIIDRLGRRTSWIKGELEFEERDTQPLVVSDTFEKVETDWVKGSLELMSLLPHGDEPHIYVCRIDNYAEIAHHYHTEKDEVISVWEGELFVELYDLETKRMTSKIRLTKLDGKFVIPAKTGHYCYAHEDTVYLVGFEYPNPDREQQSRAIDDEIKEFLDTTDSENLHLIETEIIEGLPIIIGVSANIENLGFSKLELMGQNAMEFVEVDNVEKLMNDIMTRELVMKTAQIKGGGKVVGFIRYIGGNRVNEYLFQL